MGMRLKEVIEKIKSAEDTKYCYCSLEDGIVCEPCKELAGLRHERDALQDYENMKYHTIVWAVAKLAEYTISEMTQEQLVDRYTRIRKIVRE